jgi:hypothetical protein
VGIGLTARRDALRGEGRSVQAGVRAAMDPDPAGTAQLQAELRRLALAVGGGA